jgi:hypothetical protein
MIKIGGVKIDPKIVKKCQKSTKKFTNRRFFSMPKIDEIYSKMTPINDFILIYRDPIY